MASLQKKGKGWYCQFLYHGKRHTFAVGAVSEQEAQAKSAQVDYLLLRLKQRLIELPPNVGIVDFIQHDGKPPASELAIPDRQILTGVLHSFRAQGTQGPRSLYWRSKYPAQLGGIEA